MVAKQKHHLPDQHVTAHHTERVHRIMLKLCISEAVLGKGETVMFVINYSMMQRVIKISLNIYWAICLWCFAAIARW